MKSELIDKILKDMPLINRLKVDNEAAFLTLIHELGYRQNKMWDENDEKENEILRKLTKFAFEHTKTQMKTIEKWAKDHNVGISLYRGETE